jgi:ABC-type amino acid transport substrate-binding protein
MRREINGPADLVHRTVGAMSSSSSLLYLKRAHITCQTFPDIPSAVGALKKHQIAAFVSDAPALEYYEQRHPEQPVTVVGPLWDRLAFCFAFPIGSELRRAVNVQLLDMIESGDLEKIRAGYFGASQH